MNSDAKAMTQVREMRESDLPMIYTSWVNGFYFGSDKPKDPATERKEKARHRKMIEYIINNKNVHIAVACNKEDQDQIFGYSVFENKDDGSLLHWIFVKPVYRRLGLGKSLTPETINEVSHLTKLGKSLKPVTWKYNPFFV